MMKRILLAGLLALSGSAAIGAVASMPFATMVKADSNERTDITTSDPFHDLTLIYLDGDMSKFTGPSCFLRKDRPNDYFQVCGFRPYGNDLYIYLYFDNSSPLFPGFDKDVSYYGDFTIAEKGEGNSAISAETSVIALTEIGSRWKSGAQNSGGPYYFVKLKAEGIFPDDAEENTYDIIMNSLGKMKGSSYSVLYDVNEEYCFTYKDENYDIAAKWWANNAVVMSPTKGVVRMIQENSGSYFDGLTMKYVTLSSGYYEDFFLFFNLSKEPSYIVSIDFYYTEIEFYGSALKEYRNNAVMDITNGKWGGSYNVPSDISYSVGNEIETKYKDTEWATKTTQKFKTVRGDQKVVHNTNSFTWLPPFSVGRKVTTPEIVDMNHLSAQIQDEDQRKWLSENGGSYRYATLIGSNICDWTDKLDREDTYYAPLFPEVWNTRTDYHYLYKAHAFDNGYALKMIVKDENGKDASWNVFNHSVYGYEHVLMDTHDATVEEWSVSVGKKVDGWIKDLVLTAYAGFAVALVALEGFLVIKDSSNWQKVERPQDKKGTKQK